MHTYKLALLKLLSQKPVHNMFLLQPSLGLQTSCTCCEKPCLYAVFTRHIIPSEVIYFEKLQQALASLNSPTLTSCSFRACSHLIYAKAQTDIHQSSPYTIDQNTFDFFSSKANINFYLPLLKTLIIQDSLLKNSSIQKLCFSLILP
ncbi:hypothetical protein YC2023_079116 [Brassica napus]